MGWTRQQERAEDDPVEERALQPPCRGQHAGEQQHSKQRAAHGLPRVAGNGGDEQAEVERKKQRDDERQDDAPEFRAGHAAHHQGQREDGKDGQQTVNGLQRSRQQLAEHHVVAFQVGEEQESKGAFALLFAQAIGGEEHSGQQTESEGQHAEGDEEMEALLRGR